MKASAIPLRLGHLHPALAALAVLLGPAGTASAQVPEGGHPPGVEGRSDGRELYTPPCVPTAARAATAEKGKIKFVICDDNVTVESVATTSDIIFSPGQPPRLPQRPRTTQLPTERRRIQ